MDRGHFTTQSKEDGTAIITTELLNEYIVACVIQEHKQNPWCLTHQTWRTGPRKSFVHAAMPRVGSINKTLQHLRQELRTLNNGVADGLHPLVWDSLLILGGTLDTLAALLYRACYDSSGRRLYRPVSFGEFKFRSIYDIRLDGRWCPRESLVVAQMMDNNPLMLAFVGQIHATKTSGDHGSCNEARCKASIINKETYTQIHDSSKCTGHCVGVGFSEDEHPCSQYQTKLRQATKRLESDVDLEQTLAQLEASGVKSNDEGIDSPQSLNRPALIQSTVAPSEDDPIQDSQDSMRRAATLNQINRVPGFLRDTKSRILSKEGFQLPSNLPHLNKLRLSNLKSSSSIEIDSSTLKQGSQDREVSEDLGGTNAYSEISAGSLDYGKDEMDSDDSSNIDYLESIAIDEYSDVSSIAESEMVQQVKTSESSQDYLGATALSDQSIAEHVRETLNTNAESDVASSRIDIDPSPIPIPESDQSSDKAKRFNNTRFGRSMKRMQIPGAVSSLSRKALPRDAASKGRETSDEISSTGVPADKPPPQFGERVQIYKDESQHQQKKPSIGGVLASWRTVTDFYDQFRNASDSSKSSSVPKETPEMPGSNRDQPKQPSRNPLSLSYYRTSAVTFENGELRWSSYSHAMTKAKLVAISHVWKDGLGNPSANTLPACQLSRLQELANGLYPKRSGAIPFYIDTLLIPHSRKNPTPEQKAQKTRALSDMEWTYKFAGRVLVLDEGLMSVKSSDLGADALAAHVLCSSWARRLWTLQEGRAMMNTYFQFQDGAVNFFKKFGKEKKTDQKFSKWTSELEETHPLCKKQKIGLFLDQRGTGNAMLFQRSEAFNHLDPLLYETLNPVGAKLFSFIMTTADMLHTVDSPYNWRERLFTSPQFMQAMYYRDLTERADEALVLSSMVHFSPGSAAKLHTVPENNRLQELWRSMKLVPQGLVFLDQQRYTEFGCGWMPKTLLSTSWPASRPLIPGRLAATLKRGLGVRVMGLRLDCRKVSTDFRIQHVRRADSFQMLDELFHYSVHLRQPGSNTPVTPSAECEWAILPEPTFWEMPERCSGLLVGIVEGRKAMYDSAMLAKVVDSVTKKLQTEVTIFEAFADMERIDDKHIGGYTTPWFVARENDCKLWTIG